VAVRLRLKKIGRKSRPFFRVCAMDGRSPRDGRVIEELGSYDPMIADTDARVILNAERVGYWLSVGAQPSHTVGVLIRKYGKDGTHLAQQKAAVDKLSARRQNQISMAVNAASKAAEKEKTRREELERKKAEEAAAAASAAAAAAAAAQAAAEQPAAEPSAEAPAEGAAE
jgi:small subunit ribosomal protein S16